MGGRGFLCVSELCCFLPSCLVAILKLRDQIKTSGWGGSVWLECKVATALRANVHAVRSCHSDQSLSTPSSPPVPIQLQPIHWIQSWPNTVHVESQIKYKSIHPPPPQQHFLTHPRCPQMGAHSNLPAGVPRGWVESWRRLPPCLDTPGNLNSTKCN